MNVVKKYILSIDQSTSATKAMLFDNKAKLLNKTSVSHKQIYPQPGFVEHDAEEIFTNTLTAIRELIKKTETDPAEIDCLSITNQRETCLLWDRHTGKPVSNAAVWQCMRGSEFCKYLREDGYSEKITSKTGLVIDPYFSASKIKWLIDNTPGLKIKAINGDLLMGTIDTWLIWKLTGGKVHATDYTNACRTMLFNIHKLGWDSDLLKLFGLNSSMLPAVRFSDETFGEVSADIEFIKNLPLAGITGDSHAAFFGQNCFSPGMTKATYGTGSSVMMNIGKQPVTAPEGLVTSIGYGMKGAIDYVFEGNIHCSGDTINWLVNEMKLIGLPAEAESIAETVSDTGGVYFVPGFVGLGAPYWDQEARASVSGINRDTTKAHIVRAALESMAWQIKDLIDLMIKESDIKLQELRVDGGPTRNDLLMQFQSDILNRKVVRSNIGEISALGSAFLAGLATGFWEDINEIKKLWIADKTFKSRMPEDKAYLLYQGWKKAVERVLLK
jgi:glycerol kinase